MLVVGADFALHFGSAGARACVRACWHAWVHSFAAMLTLFFPLRAGLTSRPFTADASRMLTTNKKGHAPPARRSGPLQRKLERRITFRQSRLAQESRGTLTAPSWRCCDQTPTPTLPGAPTRPTAHTPGKVELE